MKSPREVKIDLVVLAFETTKKTPVNAAKSGNVWNPNNNTQKSSGSKSGSNKSNKENKSYSNTKVEIVQQPKTSQPNKFIRNRGPGVQTYETNKRPHTANTISQAPLK